MTPFDTCQNDLVKNNKGPNYLSLKCYQFKIELRKPQCCCKTIFSLVMSMDLVKSNI